MSQHIMNTTTSINNYGAHENSSSGIYTFIRAFSATIGIAMYVGTIIGSTMYAVYDGPKFSLFCVTMGNILVLSSTLIFSTSILNFSCLDIHGDTQQKKWIHPLAVVIFTVLCAIYFWTMTIEAFCLRPDEVVPIVFCGTIYSLFTIAAIFKTKLSFDE